MILFCLDTSGPVAGAAVLQDGVVRCEIMASSGMTHSQSILPMAEEAFLRAGLSLQETDLFAVTVGPGSFTGVRIGVSTVKGLAHALGKPCVAVDALEAMAAGVQPFSGVICPLQDARAGQVYAAAFEGRSLRRLMPDQPIKLSEFLSWAEALEQPLLFLGDGTAANRDMIRQTLGGRAELAPAHLAYLRPAAAAFLAWEKRNEAVDYLSLSPLYLRPPQAERQKNLRELGHE